MEWNFLVYLWLRVEEHGFGARINSFLEQSSRCCFDFVRRVNTPISPIKKHRKKEKGKKKEKKTCRERTSGIHADFLFKKGRAHFPFCRIIKMRRILGEREISTFCILLLFCPFDLSVCLPAEQPIRYTLNTGDVKTRDTGTPFNFEQNRVSI